MRSPTRQPAPEVLSTEQAVSETRSSGDGKRAAPGTRSTRGSATGITTRHRAARAGRTGRQGAHVVAMQRRRLLSATVELVFERGAQALTVAMVCERAGLSRRTFYEIYDGREDCLLATFNDAVAQATHTLAQATAATRSWREQVRTGLTALLCFFDREPGIGRLLIVEALSSGEQTLKARSRVLTRIIAIIDQGRTQTRTIKDIPPLTAEGIAGGVFGVIHARMLTHTIPATETTLEEEQHGQPALSDLTGALMAMILAPYLGPAAARHELDQPTSTQPATPNLPSDPFKDLPIRLTYRTVQVLSSIAAKPGASSKQVAQASGITDDGQISRLLTRLQRNTLIQDTGIGPTKGKPRAWQLTPHGQHILHATRHD